MFIKTVFVKTMSIWSNLIQFDPIWSNLIQSDPIWSNLIQFDPIWSRIIHLDLTCQKDANLQQFSQTWKSKNNNKEAFRTAWAELAVKNISKFVSPYLKTREPVLPYPIGTKVDQTWSCDVLCCLGRNRTAWRVIFLLTRATAHCYCAV